MKRIQPGAHIIVDGESIPVKIASLEYGTTMSGFIRENKGPNRKARRAISG